MSKEYYAAIVLSPLQVMTNLKNTIAAKEAGEVALFTSPSSAFNYVSREAETKSMQAHTTPIGSRLNEFFQLQGVGIMYRVVLPSDAEPVAPSEQEKFRGIVHKCSITDALKLEQQAIFVADDFHDKPAEVVPMAKINDELSARAQNYELLEAALANTPIEVRRQYSPELMSYESVRMASGPDAPARNGFTTPYPQDQKFWDIHKMLWENKAGAQYVVETLPTMYSKYRDSYARSIVNDLSPELASAKAAVVVLNWASDLAKSYHDTRMEDVLQEAGEKAALDALNIEREEQSRNEI